MCVCISVCRYVCVHVYACMCVCVRVCLWKGHVAIMQSQWMAQHLFYVLLSPRCTSHTIGLVSLTNWPQGRHPRSELPDLRVWPLPGFSSHGRKAGSPQDLPKLNTPASTLRAPVGTAWNHRKKYASTTSEASSGSAMNKTSWLRADAPVWESI